ncbi:hypothetical protein KFK09_022696 [Dendrobium nobile]|uniref:Uncharacterized protein n=1 Tax=Dendrobium nobile TaxID=94219 RepID=A0A8T3AJV3_DENNO|nr:hypothetical protein KFK09_022680 [Dendrobium nobile]KAI0496380.1 hypothetical protein KFK09_022696 [Dendrobium nobile]
MAGGKRVRQTSWSSSRARIDPHFREAEDEAAYHRYKECGITVSRIINPTHISYPVMDLFAHTSLCFILSLAFPFNSEFLREFFANLRINPTFTALSSYVNRRPVEITYHDCVDLLQLSTTGDKLHLIAPDPDLDWSTANHFLHQTNVPYHVGETSSLVKDARTIQHVLRTYVIPKAGDRIHITPLLSLTTFYIMDHREFNTADLLFRYIDHLITISDPGHKRKPNLALGHIIAYVLETKYQLQYPIPPKLPTPFYSNNSFTALHSTRLHLGDGEGRGGERGGGSRSRSRS